MHLVFLTPSPEPPGGGQAFNAGLVPALRDLGATVDVRHSPDVLPRGAVPIIDGLLLPWLERAAEHLVALHPIVIVHHVSAAAGQDRSAREAVHAVERALLPRMRRVIATSTTVADRLVELYGLAPPALLRPGLPVLPRSPGSGGACHLLAAGVLTPRKGLDRLLQALARLTDLDWTLTIAGDARRDAAHAATLAPLAASLGLTDRVTLLPDPSPDALEAEWARTDLFLSASAWEGWPAAVAEALRRGIPAVATEVGETAAILPVHAGVLCRPDDMVTYGKCLRRAIFDTAFRAALAEGAWQAGQDLPGWETQARAFLGLLEH